MKNNFVRTGMKIGSTVGGLMFLSLGIVPSCSSAVSIVVTTILATVIGALWLPAGR